MNARSLFWLACAALMAAAEPLKTANPDAMPEARRILNYLARLPEREQNRVVSGHFVDLVEGGLDWERYLVALFEATGKWPALLGADYQGRNHDYDRSAIINRRLSEYWNAGGLIAIQLSARNPWTGKDMNDRTRTRLTDLITLGTDVHGVWMQYLDRIAEGLAELRDAGVVVLWRPLHEMNGRWFWWGGADKEDYVALWRHMFDYFTKEKGLNNLLWVYSPSGDRGTYLQPEHFYPGDGYCDVIGIDNYTDDVDWWGYEKLLEYGKPFGAAEFGPGNASIGAYDYSRVMPIVAERFPRTSFIMIWGFRRSFLNNQGGPAFLEHPWIITRDELDWRTPPVTELEIAPSRRGARQRAPGSLPK